MFTTGREERSPSRPAVRRTATARLGVGAALALCLELAGCGGETTEPEAAPAVGAASDQAPEHPLGVIPPDEKALADAPAADVPATDVEGDEPALRLAGRDVIVLYDSRGVPDLEDDFTIELWLRWPHSMGKTPQFIAGGDAESQPDETAPEGTVDRLTNKSGWRLYTTSEQDGFRIHCRLAGEFAQWIDAASEPVAFGSQWRHIAAVRRGDQLKIYHNGQSVASQEIRGRVIRGGHVRLGAQATEGSPERFDTDVRGFRISDTARYEGPFAPPREWANDKRTLALLDFSVGGGQRLPDLSGNGHWGPVREARWIRVAELPQPSEGEIAAAGGDRPQAASPDASLLPPSQEGSPHTALRLVGREHVELKATVTTLQKLESDFTIELWTRWPADPEPGPHPLVGNHGWIRLDASAGTTRCAGWFFGVHHYKNGEGRLEFGVAAPNGRLIGMAGGPVPATSAWRHVAMSKKGSEFREFCNGVVVGQEAFPVGFVTSPLGICLGPHPLSKSDWTLTADIAAVRISSVARYWEDFTPPPRLTADDETVVLLDFSATDPPSLADLSGRGHSGQASSPRFIHFADELAIRTPPAASPTPAATPAATPAPTPAATPVAGQPPAGSSAPSRSATAAFAEELRGLVDPSSSAGWLTKLLGGGGPNIEELIAAVQRSADAATEMAPGVLIMPVLDGRNADGVERVWSYGFGFSQVATLLAADVPQRRMALDPRTAYRVLWDVGSVRPNAGIGPTERDLCDAEMDGPIIATPRIELHGSGLKLAVSFRGGKTGRPNRVMTHQLELVEIPTIPNVLARDVLQYLDVPLTEEEQQLLARPQAATRQDCESLQKMVLYGYRGKGVGQDSPEYLSPWIFLLDQYFDTPEHLQRLARLKTPPVSDTLRIFAAQSAAACGRPGAAAALLLRHSARLRGDDVYHNALAIAADQLGEPSFLAAVLEDWRLASPGSCGCRNRGYFWEARAREREDPSRSLKENRDAMRADLEHAQKEFEAAIRINPQDWIAHSYLVRVARLGGLPMEYMESHFREAIRLVPRYPVPYVEKLTYLLPNRYGDPEKLAAFAGQCVETGLWDIEIPQRFPLTIEQAYEDPRAGGFPRAPFRTDSLWRSLQAYHDGAREHASRKVAAQADRYFALWAAYGGHYTEAAPLFEKLGRGNILLNPLFARPFPFADFWEFEYLYDLVHAETGKLPKGIGGKPNPRVAAQIRIALSQGDLDGAQRLIDQAEKEGELDPKERTRYRNAVALGRKLVREKTVQLTAYDIADTFLDVDDRWGVEDGVLVGHPMHGIGSAILFPLGVRRATIEGEMEWNRAVERVKLLVHSRAQRDYLQIVYETRTGWVRMKRGQWTLGPNPAVGAAAPYPSGPIRFRLIYDSQQDQLEPFPGLTYPMHVCDDVPSGFGIAAQGLRDASLRITSLTIKLPD